MHGVPLFMRAEGAPSSFIGLVYLASIPYLLMGPWAPAIDRAGVTAQLGHDRSWIMAGQIAMVAFLFALTLVSPAAAPLALVVAVFLVMTTLATQDAATQDAATSGLMVRGLAAADLARGAAFKAGGAAIAGALVWPVFASPTRPDLTCSAARSLPTDQRWYLMNGVTWPTRS